MSLKLEKINGVTESETNIYKYSNGTKIFNSKTGQLNNWKYVDSETDQLNNWKYPLK